jgi:hypothetical protein
VSCGLVVLIDWSFLLLLFFFGFCCHSVVAQSSV